MCVEYARQLWAELALAAHFKCSKVPSALCILLHQVCWGCMPPARPVSSAGPPNVLKVSEQLPGEHQQVFQGTISYNTR